MNKALIIVKSPGIGDLQILLSNIHSISKQFDKPVTVLAQENTRAHAVFKHDPHVDEVLNLGKRDFFNIINEIKIKKFSQCYIYSDSVRLFLIAKLAGISKINNYPFFSKKRKNFYKTAKKFTEKILQKKIDSTAKIYWDNNDIEKAKKNYDITNNTKNIICGISASGPTKCWDINNYIRLFEELDKKYKSKFFLAGGLGPNNICDALSIVDPYGVDVSTGVETDGQKDTIKVQKFIQYIRSHDSRQDLSYSDKIT